MVPRISATLFIAAAGGIEPSWAFSLQTPITNKNNIRRPICSAHYSSTTSLHMSSIPEDDDDLISSFYNIVDQFKLPPLPPAPEDHIALSGDVVALFVYTYLDHTMNELYADTAAKIDVAELITYDPNTATTGVQLPVWYDSTQLQTFGQNWLADGTPTDMYAPVIAASGLAFVSIATCWIICGYFSGAFLHQNTLECDTSKAMVVTAQTWMFTAILMVLLALGSDALWGQLDSINALSAPARGGLTIADADYIFDSLTVLAFWRFMFNCLLGYRR